jgi:membrane protease YdiL (CAAX protease family)
MNQTRISTGGERAVADRHDEPPPPSHASRFARRFLPVWGIGLLGVAAVLLQAPPAALIASTPGLRELPELAVRLLLLVNPLILVTLMAAVGAACAHRAGLRSALAGDRRARLDARLSVSLGVAVAVALPLIDAAVSGQLGPGWKAVSEQAREAPWLPALLLGVFYGGLAEEVITRWGLMSLAVWLVLLVQRRRLDGGQPLPPLAAWIGITLAAAVFAAGHLPALAQSVELSGPIVARTLGLNLLAGMAYGWLFWRRSLESAMLAHATTHIGFAVGRWLV